ncbi:MAG: signal peptidase I [Lachnospiraceae bacterium]|nr:signal peptidase I [Lachnospiraceae bacterium]
MELYYREETSRIRVVVSWIVDIIVVLAFAWFCSHSFGRQIAVAGQSMMPLLNSGDVVLVNRLIYDFAKPNRLDVVVFEREDKKTNVKRVIGLPGDVVQVQGGYLYVNGERLNAGNRLDQVSLAGLAENPVELGEGEYFLLGDNRDSSEDSRFANVGNVRQEQILGKVWLRIFPIKDFGPVRSH